MNWLTVAEKLMDRAAECIEEAEKSNGVVTQTSYLTASIILRHVAASLASGVLLESDQNPRANPSHDATVGD